MQTQHMTHSEWKQPEEVMDTGTVAEVSESAVDKVRKFARHRRELVMAAVGATRHEDWIDFGGKPYLTGAGAQRLCTIGIRTSEPEFDIQQEGEDYVVYCTITAEWPVIGQRLTEIGSCSTRDKFYFAAGEGKRSNYTKALEQAEGDERLAKRILLADVKKKAVANAMTRTVCGLLGIRDLSWDALSAYGIGTQFTAGGSVSYNSKPAAKPAATSKPRTERKRPTPEGFANLTELKEASIGSCWSTTGNVVETKQLTKRHAIKLTDSGGDLEVIYWSQDALPDFVRPGAKILIPCLEIREYRDQPQYTAHELKEPNVG